MYSPNEDEEPGFIQGTFSALINGISEITGFDADRYKPKHHKTTQDRVIQIMLNSCLWLISFYFMVDTFTLLTDSASFDNKSLMLQHGIFDKQSMLNRRFSLNLNLGQILHENVIRNSLTFLTVLQGFAVLSLNFHESYCLRKYCTFVLALNLMVQDFLILNDPRNLMHILSNTTICVGLIMTLWLRQQPEKRV